MKDLQVLTEKVNNITIGHIIPEGRVTELLLKYGFPEDELWLIEDSTISAAERFYGFDTIMDLTNGKDYKRCVYYHESGAIEYFAPYNNEQELEDGCKFIAKMFQ